MTKKELVFLGKRMANLREKNEVMTLQAMVELLQQNGTEKETVYSKSTLSRAESGALGEKSIIKWAVAYCRVFGYNEERIKHFLRGDKIVVPDTSALLKNPQLIDELEEEYSLVVIPEIVLSELNNIKNNSSNKSLATRAWEIIKSIGFNERIIRMEYVGPHSKNNDEKIISIAEDASRHYSCKVDIITNDADYSAILKGNETIKALYLVEYMLTKQNLINMNKLLELKRYYGEDYSYFNNLTKDEINAFLDDGYTLIISVIRDKGHTFKEKKDKIKWLIEHGADVNKRDGKRRFFPPLTHAIQINDYKMFIFLLNECHANPNVGSRNPYDSGKLRQRQKNEGNMPLMVAAWSGRIEFIEALCKDERTSINQQDANGFTALIKAAANGEKDCRDLLLEAGADPKIVDIDDMTYIDRYNEYLELGPMRERFRSEGNKS